MRLAPGSRVGPYEVVTLLGAGGMAEVYRAKDTRLGRDVAVKVMSEALGADAPLLERFEREAKLAGSLNHPNVVALYDVGFQDGKPYFVTELLQGESLRERLGKGPIAPGTALEWASQMAQGLAAAHERGIAHRDLKPENVFLTKDGPVKLIDFGIAKLFEAAREVVPHGMLDETVSPSGSSTGTGMVLGTPGYMSPEQVRGDVVDARTDFFSLGAVLYEMLSGHRAFASGSVVESGYAILHAEPEALPPSIPAPVAQVVRRCLEKEPSRRFQSARDLAFHLELLRTPSASMELPAVSGVAGASRWRRWAWPLAAAASAALVAGAGMYLVGRGTRIPTPSVEQVTFRRGTVGTARYAPDGRVVYSAGWGADPLEVYTRAPGSPDTQSLGVQGAQLLGVSSQDELAVSLHPLWFGIEGVGGTLAFVPGTGGVPRPVAKHILFADWSPTGELAVVRVVGSQRQLEYPLGTPLYKSGVTPIAFPRISPNGEWVAFFHASPPELLLVDKKGSVRRLQEGSISGLAWGPGGQEVWYSHGSAVSATSLTGNSRLLYQGLAPMKLEDISRDGKVLLNVEEFRREMVLVPPGQERERELPWLDATLLAGLSDDGSQVLFTAFPVGAPLSYLRPTNGSAAVKLGAGVALAFSPDEKWVLAGLGKYMSDIQLSLLPVGVGVPKQVPTELTFYSAQFLRDGQRVVVVAQTKGDKEWRLYVLPLDGGAPTLLSKSAVVPYWLSVSRDNRFVAATNFEGVLTLFPVDGGPDIPTKLVALPVGWTSEGQLWVTDSLTAFREAPTHLWRYDLKSRSTVAERTFSPTDPTGVVAIGHVFITPDSRTVAYEYIRLLGYLYQLDGLAPAHK